MDDLTTSQLEALRNLARKKAGDDVGFVNIADARALGITVLPPDINESDTDFKVVYTHPVGNRKATRAERVKA